MTCKRIINFLLLTALINFVYLVPLLAQPKTIAALRQQLDSAMKKQHVAGMMLALVNKDAVVYTGGVGYADWEKKIPVSDTQLFRLSSITKMFTALGILNLIKEGKLSVGTRLKTIAPEIPFTNDWEASNPVTIETLLEHTTGFSDKSPLEEFIADNKKYRPLDAVLVFKKFMHSRWKPGEAHAYSGVNYAVLAYVLEKVSGQTINGYLRQKVFTPLGMPYANMHLTDDGNTAYSKAYSWKNNQMQPVPHVPYYNAGYASLNASAVDCAHALTAYLNNWKIPNGQFLSPAIMYDAETPHTYLSAREGLKNTYGYGNECYEYKGQLFRGHLGAMGGYLSAFLYSRKSGMAYAFSINTFNEDFFWWADGLIRQFLLQGVNDSTAMADYRINTKAVAPYKGYYRLSNPGQLYTGFFESMQNTLQVKQNGNNLNIHVLLRGTMKWKAADSTGKWFKDAGTAYPQNMLLRDADNRPVIVHNTLYFKKVPAFEAWMPVVLFIGSALLLFISLAVLIVVRLIFIFKKIKTPLFLLLLSPAMLFVGLMIIALSILRILDDMGANAQMGGDRVLWQLGKYTVAVFSIGTVCLLAYQWKQLGKLSRAYFSVTASAGLYALWILIANHWFG